jgi:hypothetical protein
MGTGAAGHSSRASSPLEVFLIGPCSVHGGFKYLGFAVVVLDLWVGWDVD